jgi:CHAT domain-containing protein/Tfp pilus assembly protein PilF
MIGAVCLLICLSFGVGGYSNSSLALSSNFQAAAQSKGAEQKQSDRRELKPGQVIERDMAGGEAHEYRIALSSGQYLKAVVEQKGIDVVVRLFGPGEKKLMEVDSPNGTLGPEPVFFIADATGEYRLEVRSFEEKAAPARYEIKIAEMRESTATDRDRIAAERTFAQAEQLRVQETAESLRKAIEKYNEALPLFHKLGDGEREATTLNLVGVRYWELGDNQKALEYYDQSLRMWRSLGNRKEEGQVLHNFGTAYWQSGDSQKALEYYAQALPLIRAVGDRPQEAITLNTTGLAYYELGQLQEALNYFNKALVLLRLLENRRDEATTLLSLGAAYFKLGDLQKSLEYDNQALVLRRTTGDRRGEGATLNNIGMLFLRLGEPQRALEYHNQALPLRRETGDRFGEVSTLHNIGVAYKWLGELQKAGEHYDKALALARAIGDRRDEASTLQELGAVYQSLGEPQKALEYYNQSLLLRQASGDKWAEAITLSHIGDNYIAWRKPEEALKYLHQALSLQKAVGDEGYGAVTLQSIARAERDSGQLSLARSHIEAALKIIESTRSKFVSQELRTSYLASNQEYYEFYIDLLMQSYKRNHVEQQVAEAIGANERSLARSLLDSLTETHADIREGVDSSLLEREHKLQQLISVKSERLTRLLSSKHTEAQETPARKEVEFLLTEYQDAEAEIRRRSPRYAALTQPEPLSLKDIQQQVLEADTLLLEYAMGKDRSYLWAVTPTSISSYELPNRAEVETAARRFYELVTKNKNRELQTQIEAGAVLSRMLLGPVREELGQKRLVIVVDGGLRYVPFAALPDPNFNSKGTVRYQPLIVQHEIVSQPSASALGVLRRELDGRRPVAKTVAVLADPVFQSDDPRVKRTKATTDQVPAPLPKSEHTFRSDVERSAWETGAQTLERLEYSRREAEAIVAQTPKGQSLKALDFSASREAAMSDTLGQYRIIHFATHSLLNNVHPELSGIVLSLVDQLGRAQNGFLRLHEVYNLKLPAELVVLSSCQTGLGKEVKGEGLVGLTRGFMYAGAARVVVSSWAVSDEATAELMKRFYQSILKRNLRPAAALREAQITMWRSQWWEAPFYWAGFGLQGEWR